MTLFVAQFEEGADGGPLRPLQDRCALCAQEINRRRPPEGHPAFDHHPSGERLDIGPATGRDTD